MSGISIWQLIVVFLFLVVFPLPTYIALKKKHPHKLPIILINLLGGLVYGVGWLVALVWCFVEPKTPPLVSNTGTADEIKKLQVLK